MVHVPLFVVRVQIVKQILGIPRSAQGGNGQDLGESSVEQARPVDAVARQQSHAARNGSDLIEFAAINAYTILNNLVAHQGAGQLFEDFAQCLAVFADDSANWIVFGQFCDRSGNSFLHHIQCIIATGFIQLELFQHFLDAVGGAIAHEVL